MSENTHNTNIYRLLRIARDDRKCDTAKKLGISQTYVNEIEKDRRTPSVNIIAKYAITYGIDIETLKSLPAKIKHLNFEHALFMILKTILCDDTSYHGIDTDDQISDDEQLLDDIETTRDELAEYLYGLVLNDYITRNEQSKIIADFYEWSKTAKYGDCYHYDNNDFTLEKHKITC